MMQLDDALGPWRQFYSLLGSASGTLVALLFVAASVGTGVFTSDRQAAMRVFLTASVVNFSLVLATCLIVLAPLGSWMALGVLILVTAAFGLGHSGLALRDALGDGLIHKIDLEDRVWYIVLPVVGYASLGLSGIVLALRMDLGCAALAVSAGLLLCVGIHNAWDITVWSMTRRGR